MKTTRFTLLAWTIQGINAVLSVLFLLLVYPAFGSPPAGYLNTPDIIKQDAIGPMACGPCALLDALKFGGEEERSAAQKIPGKDDIGRVLTIIARYGNRLSKVYPDRVRYSSIGGCQPLEMLDLSNDLLLDCGIAKVKGAYLDHAAGAKFKEQIHQVYQQFHHSLELGFPPVVAIQSWGSEADTKAPDGYSWKWLFGHYVAVVKVPSDLPPAAVSFTMQVADPSSGKVQDVFVYEENVRAFTACKGDDRKFSWIQNSPFLVVIAPWISLKTDTEPWYLRTNITLSYAILRG